MEVIFTWSRKPSKCEFCPELVNHAEPIVLGRPKKQKGKPWPRVRRWHPECFLQSGMNYLVSNPYYQAPSTGRPMIDITSEQRATRNKILRRYGAYQYKLRQWEKKPAQTQEILLNRAILMKRMQGCVEEIQQYGGVPKSWEYLLANTAAESLEHPLVQSELGVTPAANNLTLVGAP